MFVSFFWPIGWRRDIVGLQGGRDHAKAWRRAAPQAIGRRPPGDGGRRVAERNSRDHRRSPSPPPRPGLARPRHLSPLSARLRGAPAPPATPAPVRPPPRPARGSANSDEDGIAQLIAPRSRAAAGAGRAAGTESSSPPATSRAAHPLAARGCASARAPARSAPAVARARVSAFRAGGATARRRWRWRRRRRCRAGGDGGGAPRGRSSPSCPRRRRTPTRDGMQAGHRAGRADGLPPATPSRRPARVRHRPMAPDRRPATPPRPDPGASRRDAAAARGERRPQLRAPTVRKWRRTASSATPSA